MKYLIVGVWEDGVDGCPHVETLPTDVAGGDDFDQVADVVRRIRRKARRQNDPARVLVVESVPGPKVRHEWQIGSEYGACRFTDPRGVRQPPLGDPASFFKQE